MYWVWLISVSLLLAPSGFGAQAEIKKSIDKIRGLQLNYQGALGGAEKQIFGFQRDLNRLANLIPGQGTYVLAYEKRVRLTQRLQSLNSILTTETSARVSRFLELRAAGSYRKALDYHRAYLTNLQAQPNSEKDRLRLAVFEYKAQVGAYLLDIDRSLARLNQSIEAPVSAGDSTMRLAAKPLLSPEQAKDLKQRSDAADPLEEESSIVPFLILGATSVALVLLIAYILISPIPQRPSGQKKSAQEPKSNANSYKNPYSRELIASGMFMKVLAPLKREEDKLQLKKEMKACLIGLERIANPGDSREYLKKEFIRIQDLANALSKKNSEPSDLDLKLKSYRLLLKIVCDVANGTNEELPRTENEAS